MGGLGQIVVLEGVVEDRDSECFEVFEQEKPYDGDGE